MIFPDLQQFDHFVIDVETTGLNWWLPDVNIYSFAILTPDGKGYYWDIREEPKVTDWLRDQLNVYQGRIIGHNLKFDVHMFNKLGIDLLKNKIDCTLIRACLIDEHRFEYSLDSLGQSLLNTNKHDPYEKLAIMFGGKATRKDQILNMQRAEARDIAERYTVDDVKLTYELWKWQETEIEKQNLYKIIDLERQVMYPLIMMERQGVRVDIERAERSQIEIGIEITKLQNQLNKKAGFSVNPNPSGSIHKLFQPKKRGSIWVSNDGTVLEETKAGKASISAKALRNMTHPCAAIILELRELKKCSGTFIQKHILDKHYQGRVYPNINQNKGDKGGTIYGRLSYTQPALQQIPSRNKKIASLTRVLFLPEEGQRWYKMDYAQADARACVHYTQSPPLVQAYKDNPDIDFYQITADLTGLVRSPTYSGEPNSKQISLGLLFSMGEGTLAKEMGLPYIVEYDRNDKPWNKPGPEAREVFDNFHRKVPGIKEFSQKATSVARSRGYIMSIMGRHMRFPNGNFSYKAAGYLYASATAEFNKIKMVDTFNLLQNTDSSLILSIHDELNFSSDNDKLMKEVKLEMENFDKIKLNVPMKVDVGVGQNWYLE